MRSRVAVVAALDRELRPLVKGWKLESSGSGLRAYSSELAIAVCAGMGRQRAELAAHAAFAFGPVSQVISMGWAGGLHAGMDVGTVQFVNAVIDVRTREKFALQQQGFRDPGFAEIVLVTMDRVVSAAEKRRLREDFSADLVDMEAAAVARVAREHGAPFLAIKAVSDGPEMDLPGMEEFVTSDGQMREGSFAAYVALRPTLWGPVLSLAKNSAIGARRLATEVTRYLMWNEKRSQV